FPRPRAEIAVDLADIAALIIERDLHLADLLDAHACSTAPAAAVAEPRAAGGELRSGRAHRHRGTARLAALAYHAVVLLPDDVGVAARVRMDLDQDVRDRDDPHPGRDHRADTQAEVDVADPRHVAATQYRLSDPSALLGVQRHAAALLDPTLRLTLAL